MRNKSFWLRVFECSRKYQQKGSKRCIFRKHFIIGRNKIYKEKSGKVSICFEIAHESGSLYNILSHIIFNNLNMTKIESRPIEGKKWEYRFFVDFEGKLGDAAVRNALKGIGAEAISLKVLGNF